MRPAGQTDILAPLMQMLIDRAESDDDDFEEIFRPIAVPGFDWDLRRPPFKHLILVNEKVPKKMSIRGKYLHPLLVMKNVWISLKD